MTDHTEDIKPETTPQQAVGVDALVMRCRDCCHWQQDTFFDFEGVINTGYCGAHLGLKVEFELRTGWDGGVVDKVETEEDFFCANFNIDCDA
jgi:hypothetical protein